MSQNAEYRDIVVMAENDKHDRPAENGMTCGETLLTIFSIILIIITFPLSIFFCLVMVNEYERIVIFRMGRLRYGIASGAGIYFVIPCIDNYHCISLRTVTFNVPPQDVLTKDSVTVTVDAVVYYRTTDALKAVMQVEDYGASTKLLAATSLRNALGVKKLAEILDEREAIAHNIQNHLEGATEPWGIVVERVEIKDVSLPKELQRSMAAEAEASREAKAKVIAAEGEKQSSVALQEASEIICKSPAALQLRYLQTLHSISAEKNSTIIFPLPMEIMRGFMSGMPGTGREKTE